jgi:hypothetical protein
MSMALSELETTFPVKFLEKGSASGYSMIIAKVIESDFELGDANVKLKGLDNRHGGEAAGVMVFGDVEDYLAFSPVRQLGWTS